MTIVLMVLVIRFGNVTAELGDAEKLSILIFSIYHKNFSLNICHCWISIISIFIKIECNN